MNDVRPTPSWWQHRPLWLRIVLILVAAVAFILIWWLLPPLLYNATTPQEARNDRQWISVTTTDEPSRVKAITDTRTALLAGLVGIGALGTFWMNSRNVRLAAENVKLTAKTLEVSEKNSQLAEQSRKDTVKDATQKRVTELYTKSADQLGSEKAPVRLAGLYALERLAQDNKSQRQTIVNVLCAYLQMPYTPPEAAPVEPSDAAGKSLEGGGTAASDEKRAEQEWERYEKRLHEHEERTQEQRVRITAQQILLRHISRSADKTIRWNTRIDLSGANLTEARLSGANLTKANLDGANLIRARLGGADLTGASLGEADLTEAILVGADLTGARLRAAHLAGTRLSRTDLTRAVLDGAMWTQDTIWPTTELRDMIKAASKGAAGGVSCIQDGFQVPPVDGA